MAEHRSVGGRRPICGGAKIGWQSVGCGSELRYESAANDLEWWRCPKCGNAHWFPIGKASPDARGDTAEIARADYRAKHGRDPETDEE